MLLLQVLKVNDTAIKTPSEVTWSLQDVSNPDSGRDLAGTMHKDRVAQKVKLSCKWPHMPAVEASLLLRNVNSQVNFQLTYFDVMRNGMRTAAFYVGDRAAPYAWLWGDDNSVQNVAFDFIEV